MKRFVLLLVLLSTSHHLYSEEIRYIRDKLYLNIHSGQSYRHRIVEKGLISGTPVTLLEISEDEKYTRVRTQKGNEGWLETQYLSTERAGRDLLNIANKKLAQLQEKNTSLNQQLNATKKQQQQSQQTISDLSSESSRLSEELKQIKEISTKTIQLNNDNQRLLEENQMLENEVDVLTTDNRRLNDEQKSDAFLNGAFAVLIGVMITLLVPRLWPQKPTDWA
ncbi:MAG: TIGR04211 family SH3 domain-containing protein [Pseudomonadales bacterium]